MEDARVNKYGICLEKDKLRWLTQAKAILEPIRDAGLLHSELENGWRLINEELEKRAEP